MNELGWSFHGVNCTPEDGKKWSVVLAKGVCPWCGKAVAKRYGNQGKHLRACVSRPLLTQ